MYLELDPPRPLMQPERWIGDGVTDVVLPLEWVASIGGPAKNRIAAWAGDQRRDKSLRLIWSVRLGSLTEYAGLLVHEARECLKLCPGSIQLKVEDATLIEAKSLLGSDLAFQPVADGGADKADESRLRLVSWIEQISGAENELVLGADELGSALTSYMNELPNAADFPWHGLRYFAGHLRSLGHRTGAAAFDRAFARASVFFSPLDEVRAQAQLRAGEIALNPTAIFLSFEGETPPLAIARDSDVAREKVLDFAESMLVDELTECPHLLRTKLISRVVSTHGEKITAMNLDEALSRLVAAGVALCPSL